MSTPTSVGQPRAIIIDTDPGIDDAMAILMALASPDLEVLGLTTVFGNAETSVTTNNALTILEVADRTDIPVARGESKPLSSDYIGAVPQVHGENGLGDAVLPDLKTEPIEIDAVEFMYTAMACRPGEVTLIPLGPLTNIGLLLQRHPDVTELVDEVIIMGGNALVPGNATPVAEANINNDPEAADLVFGADWKVTMVGLDVTNEVNLTGRDITRIANNSSPGSRLLTAALPHYQDFMENRVGTDGIFVHDPSTIAYLLDPEAFTTEDWPIRVETESFSRGKTWPNMGDTDEATPQAWLGRPTVTVCTHVDGQRVLDLMLGLLLGNS